MNPFEAHFAKAADCLRHFEDAKRKGIADVYGYVAKQTGLPRDECKKLLHVYVYSSKPFKIQVR